MPDTASSERKAQNRVMQRFTRPGALGYDYLGGWNWWDNRRRIESGPLRHNLRPRGYSTAQISTDLQRMMDMDAELEVLEWRGLKTRVLKQTMMQKLLTASTWLFDPPVAVA